MYANAVRTEARRGTGGPEMATRYADSGGVPIAYEELGGAEAHDAAR